MRFGRSKGAWRARLVAPVVTIVGLSGVVHAQDQVRVAVTGGVASDQRGVSSRAVAVVPTLYFVSSTGTLFSLDGNFTRYDGQASSVGIGTSLAARDRLAGPFMFALEASGNASKLSAAGSSASFITADASPVVELASRQFVLFGGGRAAVGRISQEANRRLIPGPGGNTTSVTVTRSGAGPLAGITFTSSPTPGEMLRIGVRGDRMVVAGDRVTDLTLSAAIVSAVATFSGTLGGREARGEDASFGGASLSINLNPSVTLVGGAGRYPSNRLTGALAGSYATIGLAFGSPRRTDAKAPGPPVRGVARIHTGYTRFSIEAPEAKLVEIAGDFSDWKPVSAQRAANGVWYVDLRLKPGQYRYAFRVDGRDWRVPRGATAVDDGFGGKSAWITVG